MPETIEVQKPWRAWSSWTGPRCSSPHHSAILIPTFSRSRPNIPTSSFALWGLYQEGKHPKNVGSYFGYIDESQVCSRHRGRRDDQDGKLGFVAAKPIPQVLRNINSYTLGARSIRPNCTTNVIFTGDWSLPVREAEATNSLVDQGIDVVTCHVDSPKVVMTMCEKRGIYCTGYHCNQVKLAPRGYLTGAEWNWAKVYMDYADMIRKGQKVPNLVRGGLKRKAL